MSFTNINDPAGVKALLDQLRGSQAWKDVIGSQAQKDQSTASATEEPLALSAPSSNTTAPSTSVAALLSQLRSSSWVPPQATCVENVTSHPTPPQPVLKPSAPLVQQVQDPKSLTFQQALPYIAQLADNPEFIAAIAQLKKEQEDLERQLWEDRRDIIRKFEDKVKVATTKATLIGDPGLSKHEADTLQDGLKKALEKFDRERVLAAWDGLVSKQQTILSQHKVPTMFPTSQSIDRERQQRVMDVLEGILRT
ncbi:hypothetical protein H2248_005938 [Termitomyces sp. 'cryptogamus']|nr:hypothetical protein H2248_005938 [Termitomyces sp. 'cryptogamus']